MPGRPGAGLPATERLRQKTDFQRVFREGLRIDGELFLLIAAPNRLGHRRLGLAVGRKLGGAVRRNRARRLLRESFRRQKATGPQGYDLVLVAKPGLAERGSAEVEREYRRRLQRLALRAGRAGSEDTAVPH